MVTCVYYTQQSYCWENNPTISSTQLEVKFRLFFSAKLAQMTPAILIEEDEKHRRKKFASGLFMRSKLTSL